MLTRGNLLNVYFMNSFVLAFLQLVKNRNSLLNRLKSDWTDDFNNIYFIISFIIKLTWLRTDSLKLWQRGPEHNIKLLYSLKIWQCGCKTIFYLTVQNLNSWKNRFLLNQTKWGIDQFQVLWEQNSWNGNGPTTSLI